MECAEGIMSKRFKAAFYEEELSEFLSVFIPGMPGMDTVDRMIGERNIDVSRAQTLSDELSYMVDPLTGESVDHFADRNRGIAKMIIKRIMKLNKCRGYIDDFYLKFDALRRESIRRSLASGWADEERAKGGGGGAGFDEFQGMDFDLNEEDMDEIRDVMRDVDESRDLVTESESEDYGSDYDQSDQDEMEVDESLVSAPPLALAHAAVFQVMPPEIHEPQVLELSDEEAWRLFEGEIRDIVGDEMDSRVNCAVIITREIETDGQVDIASVSASIFYHEYFWSVIVNGRMHINLLDYASAQVQNTNVVEGGVIDDQWLAPIPVHVSVVMEEDMAVTENNVVFAEPDSESPQNSKNSILPPSPSVPEYVRGRGGDGGAGV